MAEHLVTIQERRGESVVGGSLLTFQSGQKTVQIKLAQ